MIEADLGMRDFDAADPALTACGIRVNDRAGDNTVSIDDGAKPRLDVLFAGKGNRLVLRDNCAANGRIVFNGSNSTATICGGGHYANLDVWLYNRATFSWGRGSVCYGMRAWIYHETKMTIGENCLFSEQIQLRTSDHHSMIDLTTMKQINFPADIEIGNKVWIGHNVIILKGVSVGAGSIIGAGSVVSKSIGETELWTGVPATRIRENVSWVDSHPAIPEHVEGLPIALRAALGPENFRS